MNKLVEGNLSSDNEFINLIIKETPFKHKRGESRDKFAEYASKYIRQWLDELVRNRINEMAKKQTQEKSQEELILESNIITTTEEMEAYDIIKNICKEKFPLREIKFKKHPTFFRIYYFNPRQKNICRLYLNDKKKEIEIVDNKRITITSLSVICKIRIFTIIIIISRFR